MDVVEGVLKLMFGVIFIIGCVSDSLKKFR